MPFVLTSSEWTDEQSVWGYGDIPEEQWVYDSYTKLTADALAAALESLDGNASVDFHPRATLEHDVCQQQLTIYRSGRIERNSQIHAAGYDRNAEHLFLPRPEAMEIWQIFLRGDLAALDSLSWQRGADTHCPICGYDVGFPPWGESGDAPMYDICHCCGCEFGLHDTAAQQIQAVRADWMKKGCPWFWPTSRPEGWTAEKQLRNVPTDFWRAWVD